MNALCNKCERPVKLKFNIETFRYHYYCARCDRLMCAASDEDLREMGVKVR